MELISLFKVFLAISSFVFAGFIPVYFLLLYKNRLFINAALSEKVFILFLSLFSGIYVINIFLIVLSLIPVRFNFLLAAFTGLVFFMIFIVILLWERKVSENAGVAIPADLKKKPVDFKPGRTAKIFSGVFIFLVASNIFLVAFFAFLFPVRFWDALSCWSLKAKAFFIDGSILPFFGNHDYVFSHLSYPLYLPLSQTWIYIWTGSSEGSCVKILFPLFYAGLLYIIYYLLRKKLPVVVSIVFVWILSSVPIVVDHGYIEYTNLLFGIILLLGVWFFYFFLSEKLPFLLERYNSPGKYGHLFKNSRDLIMASVFFSILAQVRSEGMIFLILFLAVLFFLWIKSLPAGNLSKIPLLYLFLIAFLSAGFVLLPWLLLKNRLGIPFISIEWQEIVSGMPASGKLPVIFGILRLNFGSTFRNLIAELLYSFNDSTRAFFGSGYGPVWIILFILFLLSIRRMLKKFGWIFMVFILSGFLMIFVSLVMVEEFSWSLDRYLLHLLPLTYFWILYNLPLSGNRDDRNIDKQDS
jgi:hypothetical protein